MHTQYDQCPTFLQIAFEIHCNVEIFHYFIVYPDKGPCTIMNSTILGLLFKFNLPVHKSLGFFVH